ncbi:MAG: SPOR domain-containing protein [Lachnospiraceae bacterium]|nr:SPOR domain-containing protein [Lachnospiraceae bacterium]
MTDNYLFKTVACLLTAVMITGCAMPNSDNADEEVLTATEETESADTSDVSEGSETVEEYDPSSGNLTLSDQGKSLAQRMCGKYSYHYGAGESGEYLIMDVVNFGDNLYAFCGYSMGEDDTLSSYSFWASEFVPYDAAEMQSTDGDSVQVKELRFSVMSNRGKFWDSGQDGTITLTDDGLLFENFEDEDFLCSVEYGGRLFLKDERVEDVFPYLKDDNGAGADELQSLWVAHEGDYPVYIEFRGDNFYVYQKSPDSEVVYAAGGYDFSNGIISSSLATLGCGGMPSEYSASYEVSGGELVLTADDYAEPYVLSGEMRFSKIKPEDIPLITADEVVTGDDPSVVFGEFSDGFYGIWIAAEKDEEKAVEKAMDLHDMDYDSYMTYSPEWENLNSKPFYCVTAGRYASEAEANAALDAVKSAYPDAYVKFTGARKFVSVAYINYGDVKFDVSPDKVVIKDVQVSETNVWYPGCEDIGIGYTMTLVIDRDTVFDDTCDTGYFANYENGDRPIDWFIRNYELSQNDPETYIAEGPALSGVFEAGINGDHIDRFFGSYWWD